MRDSNRQRLYQEIAAAADRLDAAKAMEAELSQCTEPARVGDVYVLPSDTDVTLSWLVVNLYPDSEDLALVVPVDDAPFVGVCDIRFGSSPDVARCGYSFWVVREELNPEQRVSAGLQMEAHFCRSVLAKLARGQTPTHNAEQDATENDPEYWEHCREVERVGNSLF